MVSMADRLVASVGLLATLCAAGRMDVPIARGTLEELGDIVKVRTAHSGCVS